MGFSTNPSKYNIFRAGVGSSNGKKLAGNIASFANKYILDGVDLDWEYSGAPGTPGISADIQSSARNYLAFVKYSNPRWEKNSFDGYTISYWYLEIIH